MNMDIVLECRDRLAHSTPELEIYIAAKEGQTVGSVHSLGFGTRVKDFEAAINRLFAIIDEEYPGLLDFLLAERAKQAEGGVKPCA